jgi:pyridoxal phosphate enzyme (YggS family)
MPVNREVLASLKKELDARGVTLVAVSKTKPASDVMELHELGQRDFGENYVQELVQKQAELPKDIRWHFIGHLQGNKVKVIASFVHLIHGVDSLKLLQEVDKQGRKLDRPIPCLLQVHIAQEETKFGLDELELLELLNNRTSLGGLPFAPIRGLMGMASFTEDKLKVQGEFKNLKVIFDTARRSHFADDSSFATLSMGMSGDYAMAVEEGSTMVRVGSLLFGAREPRA